MILLYQESPQWIADTLNNYLASRDEKISLIKKANKSQKACSISLINESEHTGKIELVGEYYAFQETLNAEVILHHISLIDSDISTLQSVTIKYRDGVSSIAICNLNHKVGIIEA